MRALLTVVAMTGLLAGTASAEDGPSSPGIGIAAASSNDVANSKTSVSPGLNGSGTFLDPSALKKGANSFTKAQAKARVEGAGLRDITDLHQDDHGIWRGKATRNRLPVDFGFDYKGNISVE